MATTVHGAFQDYKFNLEITDRQENTVANSRAAMVTNLKRELYLHSEESKVIGSWGRNTLTRHLPEGDVDVMIILHYDKHRNWYSVPGVTACLDKFKQIIDSNYPNTVNRRDQNCITVKFKQFRLDVVPAFKWEGGFYKIPDSVRGNWIETDPFTFADYITRVNKTMDGTFVPIIKMVKGWNRDAGWPISSFHLECMLYYHYRNYTESFSYSSTLKRFFEFLPTYLQNSCYDPIRNERVDTYLDTGFPTKRQQATSKAQSAAKDAARAFSYEKTNPEASIKLWGVLLGEFFPAYG